ncbi:putative F-box domain, galactose oxidase/kelch, beta-propeller, F-box associated interaction [Medicago truncatula]|uniref:F-box protein interaction domain protein n=1 Tax=Medicago truncatula TaxID=3880 RepID=G7JRK1_MEDTR|nr:F-box/kelch-repeat protein At3g23880 [Medicago truncatula]AES88723.1 F-box protein interaction domain protein [Medicago truncatula]RHN60847.1 putative F-box domain, galactose oxidase/kelch, beta-propeller, F-box associated interaction [Medicago truncatula]
MALGSEGGDERNTVGTLTSSLPLPTLPFDLIEEILSRLPVKLLLQLQCACKSWNSLISDRKFAKKHLSLSTTHSLHCVSGYSQNFILKSYPLDSVFTNVTTTVFRRPEFSVCQSVDFVGSCNGILCFAAKESEYSNFIVRLWNPSIKKLKELPSLGEPRRFRYIPKMYCFGYDPVSDNYKVVVVFRELVDFSSSISNSMCYKDIVTYVKVYNLGTNSWKSIPMFPYVASPIEQSGQCVSGTINWLASKKSQCFIISLDLGNESYKEILLPNYGEVDARILLLSVLRDCLILFSGDDVWVMKEYGNKESWTKLFTISYMPSFIQAIHIFEDEHVLLHCGEYGNYSYIIYNCRDGTSKLIGYLNMLSPEVCVESLISPCS